MTYYDPGGDPSKFASVVGFLQSTPNEVVENNGTFYAVASSEFGATDVVMSP